MGLDAKNASHPEGSTTRSLRPNFAVDKTIARRARIIRFVALLLVVVVLLYLISLFVATFAYIAHDCSEELRETRQPDPFEIYVVAEPKRNYYPSFPIYEHESFSSEATMIFSGMKKWAGNAIEHRSDAIECRYHIKVLTSGGTVAFQKTGEIYLRSEGTTSDTQSFQITGIEDKSTISLSGEISVLSEDGNLLKTVSLSGKWQYLRRGRKLYVVTA